MIDKLIKTLHLADEYNLEYKFDYDYLWTDYNSGELYFDEEEAHFSIIFSGNQVNAEISFHYDGTVIFCVMHYNDADVWTINEMDVDDSLKKIRDYFNAPRKPNEPDIIVIKDGQDLHPKERLISRSLRKLIERFL